MEDQVTPDKLNDPTSATRATVGIEEDTQSMRSELITLAEKNEIKHSVAYIKKASHAALEKIKRDYERRQLEETNEFITETLMGKLSELMEEADMINDAKSLEEELLRNKMVKRDLKNILGYVTPYIPLIGLVCGVSIVGKHVYERKQDLTLPTEE